MKKRKKIDQAIEKRIRTAVVYIWTWVVCFVWLGFLLQNTLFSYENTIQNVSFSAASKEQYDDPFMYEFMRQNLLYQNYFWYKLSSKKSIVSTIQQIYPLIKDIKTLRMENGSLDVEVEFYAPLLLIRNNDKQRIVHNDTTFYEVNSGNTITQWILPLYLPQYLSWSTTLSGMFFPISSQQLAQDLSLIYENIADIEKVVYLAWWEKMAILLQWGKRIFVSNTKDILTQIDKLRIIQEDGLRSTSWLTLDDIYQLDLWSLEYVIIQKK